MSAHTSHRNGDMQPTVETDTESECSEDVYSDSDHGDQVSRTPATAGPRRSDPPIAKNKNMYATSDSGYSSLTTATASSTLSSKKTSTSPGAISALKKNLVQTFRKSHHDPATSDKPNSSRTKTRSSQARDMKATETREEAARMKPTDRLPRTVSQRRPSEPIRTATVPAKPAYYPPPSPPRTGAGPVVATAPRPVPRTRTASSSFHHSRPTSYHGGSVPNQLPVTYQLLSDQQQPSQVLVIDPRQPQQALQQPLQQQQQPVHHQALFVDTTFPQQAPFHPPVSYVPTPTSNSPAFHQPYGFTPTSATSYYPPPPPPNTAGWPPEQYSSSYNRRMSFTAMPPATYDFGVQHSQLQHHFPPPQAPGFQPVRPPSRRMSQTVAQPELYRPPPPPLPLASDEPMFMEDEDYYRDYHRDYHRDYQMMPPPPRPQSSHRPRPSIPHARTTSAVHPTALEKRLSRGSIEYAPEMTSRQPSFESARPPSRPGMLQRYSTTAAHNPRMQHVQAEPSSPVRRRRPSSFYDVEKRAEAALAYQNDRTGGYDPHINPDDMPRISRRPTRSSETGSRGSRGSGNKESDARHSKRASRTSLDKSKLKEQHEDSYRIDVNMKSGKLGIKPSRDGDGSLQLSFGEQSGAVAAAPTASSRPASTKPPRELSRSRSGNKYIEGSSSAKPGKDKGQVEVATKKRRSLSVQPRTGRADEVDIERGLNDSLGRLRLDNASRQSRRVSRHGRVFHDVY